MKTFKEILEENGVLLVDFISSSTYDAVVKSGNQFASQAIDEAANRAEAKIQSDMGNNYGVIVDRASILKVKELLK